MVAGRILSVNAGIDTIGDILLKIIPTLEEVSAPIFTPFIKCPPPPIRVNDGTEGFFLSFGGFALVQPDQSSQGRIQDASL